MYVRRTCLLDALLSGEVGSCEKGENRNFRFAVPVVDSHVCHILTIITLVELAGWH